MVVFVGVLLLAVLPLVSLVWLAFSKRTKI